MSGSAPGTIPPGTSPVPGASGSTPSTGHPAVDAVLHGLENAVDLPLREQIVQYEAAYRMLQDVLAGIDQV